MICIFFAQKKTAESQTPRNPYFELIPVEVATVDGNPTRNPGSTHQLRLRLVVEIYHYLQGFSTIQKVVFGFPDFEKPSTVCSYHLPLYMYWVSTKLVAG